MAKGILFAKFANFFPLQNFPTHGKCYKEQIVLIECGAYNNVLTILISWPITGSGWDTTYVHTYTMIMSLSSILSMDILLLDIDVCIFPLYASNTLNYRVLCNQEIHTDIYTYVHMYVCMHLTLSTVKRLHMYIVIA